MSNTTSIKKIKIRKEDGTYSKYIPIGADSDYVDVNGRTLTDVLSDKMDNSQMTVIETEFSGIESEIEGVTANIESLENQMETLASGSPAGVFDTVEDLTTNDPDHTKIYLVLTDGKWYYYNEINTEWTAGGVYQQSTLTEGQVKYSNIDSDLRKVIGFENVDLTDREDGYIINTANEKFPYAGYSITKPFLLKDGQTVHIDTCADNIYVSPISVVEYYDGVVVYGHKTFTVEDTSRLYSFEYTAEYGDEYIILTLNNDHYDNIYITNNYTKNNINSKLNYYQDGQHNLITDGVLDGTYLINVSPSVITYNNEKIYKKTLKVDINYQEIQSNFKYSFYRRFPLINNYGNNTVYGFAYIDMKKNSENDIPFILRIMDDNWYVRTIDKVQILDSEEYTRYYLSFSHTYNENLPQELYFQVCLPSNKGEVSSLVGQLEIREMGIIFNRYIYNSFDNLLTIYDTIGLANNGGTTGGYAGCASVIGDSCSTYKNWVPSGNPCFYRDEGNAEPNDVNDVSQTWWHLLLNDINASLLINDSYSGATICTTGYNGDDYTNQAFVTRMKNTMGEYRSLQPKPNYIFIVGGTNDTWAGSPVGQLQYSDWTTNDLKSVLPAFCYMLHYLKKWNPGCKIVNVILHMVSSEIRNGMIEACNYYGVNCAIMPTVSVESGHPNQEGMQQIKNAIMNQVFN